MKTESEKVKFWLGVSVASFIGFKLFNHYLDSWVAKPANSDRSVGAAEGRAIGLTAPIVDVRAAPGVERVTL